MFRWVKIASWIELGLFGILLVVWLVPGLEHPTFYAGLAHGIGFIALATPDLDRGAAPPGAVHAACRHPHPGGAGAERDRDPAMIERKERVLRGK